MASLNFLSGLMDQLDAVTILIVGLIATVYVIGLQIYFERMGVVRAGLGRTIGSILLPAPASHPGYNYFLQIALGLLATYAYAFVYHFLIPDSISLLPFAGEPGVGGQGL